MDRTAAMNQYSVLHGHKTSSMFVIFGFLVYDIHVHTISVYLLLLFLSYIVNHYVVILQA